MTFWTEVDHEVVCGEVKEGGGWGGGQGGRTWGGWWCGISGTLCCRHKSGRVYGHVCAQRRYKKPPDGVNIVGRAGNELELPWATPTGLPDCVVHNMLSRLSNLSDNDKRVIKCGQTLDNGFTRSSVRLKVDEGPAPYRAGLSVRGQRRGLSSSSPPPPPHPRMIPIGTLLSLDPSLNTLYLTLAHCYARHPRIILANPSISTVNSRYVATSNEDALTLPHGPRVPVSPTSPRTSPLPVTVRGAYPTPRPYPAQERRSDRTAPPW